MDSIEKIYSPCKHFDTFKCLLRSYHELMSQVKLFWKLPPGLIVTAEEYNEVKEKCDKVCAECDRFERRETD